VENASFLPWLVGTALIHSLAVTEKRGVFRSWTVLLAIFAFSFSLLGTFLVRSGVLTSVHAFATDPRRGIYILGFLVLVVGGSLSLFAARAPKVGLGGGFAAVSRESMLLVNNVLLAVAAASVMLGTLYPLLLDSLNLGKISVGPPYFEAVFVPLMAPAIFLMGVGPLARWREASLPDLGKRLLGAAIAAVVAAGVSIAAGSSLLASFGILLAAWVAGTTVVMLLERTRNAGGTLLQRIARAPRLLPRAEWGMVLAHLGVGVFIFGVTMVKTWESEKDVKMSPGTSAQLGGYTFRMEDLGQYNGPNYVSLKATVKVSKGDREVQTLYPEKRVYNASQMPMTEAAIDPGLTRDLYVSIGEAIDDKSFAVRLQVKPFVDWIWGGALIMAIGGLLAATDRRYRLAKEEKKRAAAAGLAGAKA
jgi:cytochrome c-type biogenesis protein CcmF